MYLSKVVLQESVQAKQELMKVFINGVYATHQLIWKLFPDCEERVFLYREDKDHVGRPIYYILSLGEPVQNRLLFDVKTKHFSPKVFEGQRLAYQLRANPTVAVKSNGGKSKRHDVMMHAKYEAKKNGVESSVKINAIMDQAAQHWLTNEKRLQRWGFKLDALPHVEYSQKHESNKHNKNKITFTSVDYQGVLTVADPEIFLESLYQGFGRSRSMGCGLMLIRNV